MSKAEIVTVYLLAVLGENQSPLAEDLKEILASVGAEADDDRLLLHLVMELVVVLLHRLLRQTTKNNNESEVLKQGVCLNLKVY